MNIILCKILKKSQNQNTADVGMNHWRLPDSTPLLKQGHPEQVVQMAFEYLKGGQLHNLFG